MKYMIFFIFVSAKLFANSIKPIMLYDSNVIMDKSWNEAIHRGIKKFEKKTNIDVEEHKGITLKDYEKKVTYYAKKGYNPIMLNSLANANERIIKKIMLDFPKTRLIVFNGTFNAPNAHYFVFSSQESSFLAGFLASKKSKSKRIAFVGGMKIPLIKNFLCGYIKGAKYANPNTTISYEYIDHDFYSWNSQKEAYDISTKFIKSGHDVIFSPAGGSSYGTLKAAHDNGVFGIGVDSNQNHLFSGSVLTSTMVRVDNATFRALMTAKRGIWGSQMKVLGLQENGVDLAFDEHNKHLISKELKNKIEELKADIILKKIDLPNYSFENECRFEGKVLF